MAPDVDVLIIGAGLSGIGLACHLKKDSPDRSFAIIERRQAIGGTWDLFRYPGIRSDSDMYTFGFGFRPWHGTRILSDGPRIRRYLAETAQEYGVTEHIRFGLKVTKASWSSETAQWTVHAVHEQSGEPKTMTASFLAGCTGYYDYDNGFTPQFPGAENFAGQIIHPQHWPENLYYTGKRVVVIGSGATAITLVPAMADKASHVTMLQRSPTYIVSLPSKDPVAHGLGKVPIPKSAVFRLGRARNIALQRGFYEFARTSPQLARNAILKWVRINVGPDIDMRHFSPSYNPWDQRLCVVPDGDLFKALKSDKASIVTDKIETFTEHGIRVGSGEEIPADIIVTATGLNIQVFGGAALEVDGTTVKTRDRALYKGTMLDGVPNFIIVFGYTNMSWTLKADLIADYFTRLLNHMRAKGYTRFVATAKPEDRAAESLMGSSLTSGYIKRGDAVMPRQGTHSPWKSVSDYFRDLPTLGHGQIEDGVLEFADHSGAAVDTEPSGIRAVPKLLRRVADGLPLVGGSRR